MKKIVLLIIVFDLWRLSIAQWQPLDTLQVMGNCIGSPVYWSFQIADTNSVYFYNGRGRCSPTNPGFFSIQRTINSFMTKGPFFSCCQQTFWYDGALLDLDIISTDTVFIYFYFGPVGMNFRKTTNGGSTWTDLPANRPDNLYFLTSHLGYGFTGNDFYRFYNDSIYYVSTLNNFTVNTNYPLYFFDSLTGITFLPPGPPDYLVDTLIRTTDGGLNWVQMPVPSGRQFGWIELLNNSVGYLYADSGYIYKTTNAGSNWTLALHNDSMGYIHFLSEQRAYSANIDTNGIMHYNMSINSGQNWYTTSTGDTFLYGVNIKMLNDSVGYMYGYVKSSPASWWPQAVILKTINNGGLPFKEAVPSTENLFIYPNPANTFFEINIPPDFLYEPELSFKIFDNIGRIIMQKKVDGRFEKIKLTLNSCAKGIYNIMLSNGKKNYSGRIVFE